MKLLEIDNFPAKSQKSIHHKLTPRLNDLTGKKTANPGTFGEWVK